MNKLESTNARKEGKSRGKKKKKQKGGQPPIATGRTLADDFKQTRSSTPTQGNTYKCLKTEGIMGNILDSLKDRGGKRKSMKTASDDRKEQRKLRKHTQAQPRYSDCGNK